MRVPLWRERTLRVRCETNLTIGAREALTASQLEAMLLFALLQSGYHQRAIRCWGNQIMAIFDKRKDTEPVSTEASAHAAPATDTRAKVTETSARGTAMIGKTITIKGDITGEENLVVEGRVDGTIHLKSNDLTIGQSGRVNANVTANVVRIDGEVTGDIVGIEKVVITKTGKVQGNIVGPRVTLEDGAKFKGSIDMDPTGADRAVGNQAPRPAVVGRAADEKVSEVVGKV